MGGDIWSTVLLFVLMGAVLYFLMIRPQQKRAKEQQNLMSGLAEGSRVMLISGILGTIKHLGEKQKELLRQFEDSLNGREYERRKSFGDQVKSYIRDNAERFKEKFEKK